MADEPVEQKTVVPVRTISIYMYDCAGCGSHRDHRQGEPTAGKCHWCQKPISWRYAEIAEDRLPPVGVRADVGTVFDIVSKWVSDNEEMRADVKSAMADAMDNNEAKLKVMSTAITMERAARLRRMLEYTRQVETELFNPGRVQTSDTKELTNLWNSTQTAVDKCIEHLEKSKKEGPDVDARSVHFHVGDNNVPGTVEGREVVRGIVDELIKAFMPKPVEPIPVEVKDAGSRS